MAGWLPAPICGSIEPSPFGKRQHRPTYPPLLEFAVGQAAELNTSLDRIEATHAAWRQSQERLEWANAALDEGPCEATLENFSELVRDDPEYPLARMHYGQALANFGNDAAAAAQLACALALGLR